MEPLLEKLSNEFGSREVQEDNNNQNGLNPAPCHEILVRSKDASLTS